MKLYLNEIINSDMEDDLLKQMFSLLFEYEDVILFHTFDYAVNIIGSKNSHKFFEFFREDFKLIDRNLTIRILGICDFHRTLNPLINYVNSQCELEINNGQFVISFGNTVKILNEEEILQFIYLLGTNNNCSNTFMYIFDRLIVLRQTLICFLLIENFIHMNEYHILEMLFNHEYIIISQEENAKFPSIKIGTCQRYEIMYLENFNLTYKTLKLMYDIIGKSIDNLLLPIISNHFLKNLKINPVWLNLHSAIASAVFKTVLINFLKYPFHSYFTLLFFHFWQENSLFSLEHKLYSNCLKSTSNNTM
jgi:hypothetical protein